MSEETLQFLQLGSEGLHQQNMERDLYRWLQRRGLDVQPYEITVVLQVSDAVEAQAFRLAVLPPHDMVRLIWEQGEQEVSRSLLGPSGAAGLYAFWQAYMEDPALAQHPRLQGADLGNVFPWLVHCDGAEVYNSVEYYFFSWRSAAARGNSFDVQFPICAIPCEMMRSATVKRNCLDAIADFLCWCEQALATGVALTLYKLRVCISA